MLNEKGGEGESLFFFKAGALLAKKPTRCAMREFCEGDFFYFIFSDRPAVLLCMRCSLTGGAGPGRAMVLVLDYYSTVPMGLA